LIMPLVGFISPSDPRWVATLAAIQEELVEDSLVYRYRVNEAFADRLEGRDSTFSICSFWLIECVARGGDLPRARFDALCADLLDALVALLPGRVAWRERGERGCQ